MILEKFQSLYGSLCWSHCPKQDGNIVLLTSIPHGRFLVSLFNLNQEKKEDFIFSIVWDVSALSSLCAQKESS